MTARAIIADIKRLPNRERAKVFAWIDRHLAGLDDDSPVPQRHKDILAARERDIKEGKAKFIDWETAKQQIWEMTVAKKKSRRDARK